MNNWLVFAGLIAIAVSLWLPGNLEALTRVSKPMASENRVRGSSRSNLSYDHAAASEEGPAEAAQRRLTPFRYIGAPRAVGRSGPLAAFRPRTPSRHERHKCRRTGIFTQETSGLCNFCGRGGGPDKGPRTGQAGSG